MNDFKLDNNTKIKTGFSASNEYFETLEMKILAQTIESKDSEVIVMKSSKFRWISGFAATLLLFISLTFIFNNKATTEEIDVNTLENYLSYQPDIMQLQLIQLLDDDDIQNLEIDLNLEQDELENYLETKNIEKYLID